MLGNDASPVKTGGALLMRLAAGFPRQFAGGRYRARWFYLTATGLVVLCLPFVLVGSEDAWILIVIGVPLLWVDWRYERLLSELDALIRSSPTLEPGEQLRLRAYYPLRRLTSLEILATDRRLCWGRAGLTGAAGTIGRTGRTEIDLTEITRVERDGVWLRIWTESDTYSIEFKPRTLGGDSVVDQWFAFLEQKSPTASFAVREREAIRNSRLLKPALVAIAILAVGIPYAVLLWVALSRAA